MLPVDFKAFMYENQSDITAITLQNFDVEYSFEYLVEEAMRSTDTDKAIRNDGIYVEMLKASPCLMDKFIIHPWRNIGRTRVVPPYWCIGVFTSLHKKRRSEYSLKPHTTLYDVPRTEDDRDCRG